MSPDAEAIVNEYDALAESPEMTLVELAIVGQDIEVLIANLQAVRKTIGNRLSDMMDGKATVECQAVGGVLERTRTTRWVPIEPEAERTLVTHVALAGRGQGRSTITAARNACELFYVLASPSWRVTQLRNVGLDPALYLEAKHGDWSVKIPKPPIA